jgi:hypothetical protein
VSLVRRCTRLRASAGGTWIRSKKKEGGREREREIERERERGREREITRGEENARMKR